MFGQIIAGLRNGTLPDHNLLRKRFDAALIKKMGVIKTPYSFWPADPKINPPAKHLLWAAILLHDQDSYCIVEAIITTEIEEKFNARGQAISLPTLAADVELLLQSYVVEFIELAPNKTFRENLKRLAESFFPNHQEAK